MTKNKYQVRTKSENVVYFEDVYDVKIYDEVGAVLFRDKDGEVIGLVPLHSIDSVGRVKDSYK